MHCPPLRILCLLVITCSGIPVTAADPKVQPLVFNTTTPANDLQGTFAARVQFAQSQILPAHPAKGDHQPSLTGHRKTLLLVRPLKPNDRTPINVTARGRGGNTLGSLVLDPPAKLPKTAYFFDGLPEGKIDFKPRTGASRAIRERQELERLGDADDTFLADVLRQNTLVEIQLADGRWTREIHLPTGPGYDGRVVRIQSQAGYRSTVLYSGRSVELARDQALQFKGLRGQWIRDGELDNNGLIYATNTWSGVLPAEWIAPGLTLQLRQGAQSGELTDLRVGAPTELLIHTIDVGMLTPPRDRFAFARDPEAHREYFQTVPTSRLIISQYAPLALREVMLPDGTLLTDHDPSKGDWHNGTMRQRIGKELISHGIDNANYGIHSTPGEGESSHPYVVAQLAAHNTVGRYADGIVVHGGSGGGGIVTLDNSLGNEFSHEVGHNYGLGHYVGGFEGSVHRPADQTNSTWGWDADLNRFIPNFSPARTGKETCVEKECQQPFDGRSFGLDAMAGGAPMSGINRFTLYTPNTASIIQRFLESKAVFDANSPTGFSKWNPSSGAMEPYSHTINIARQISAPIRELSEEKLASLLKEHDQVTVAMQDGNWTRTINVPPASAANRGRVVTIDHDAGYSSDLFLNGEKINVATGFQKSYSSDGVRWNEGPAAGHQLERKPQSFGVPVTTLIGYYDPEGKLRSSIYPALHGAYGFTYGDDHSTLNDVDCHLLVETADGSLKFRLASNRLSPKVMNKFHVNVPESSQPRSVAVVVQGKVLDKRPIEPAGEKLTFTVNGAGSRAPAAVQARPAARSTGSTAPRSPGAN